MSDYQKFIAWLNKTYPTHARAYSSDPVIQSAYFAGMAEGHKVCTSDEWLANAAQSTQPDDLADLLASMKSKQQRIDELESQMQGLSNEINDFQNTIEKQRHVMNRAMAAWDTTTHQKNGDGRLWQCMEELRGEL